MLSAKHEAVSANFLSLGYDPVQNWTNRFAGERSNHLAMLRFHLHLLIFLNNILHEMYLKAIKTVFNSFF